MLRRYIAEQPTSRLAIWARRTALFSLIATILAIVIVRSGLLEFKPALATFGGAGVVRNPRLQELLRYICERGFEHHVAANLSTVGRAVHEATTRYLGWKVDFHNGNSRGC